MMTFLPSKAQKGSSATSCLLLLLVSLLSLPAPAAAESASGVALSGPEDAAVLFTKGQGETVRVIWCKANALLETEDCQPPGGGAELEFDVADFRRQLQMLLLFPIKGVDSSLLPKIVLYRKHFRSNVDFDKKIVSEMEARLDRLVELIHGSELLNYSYDTPTLEVALLNAWGPVPRFVTISPGTFQMGSATQAPNKYGFDDKSEKLHEVKLTKEFQIQIAETTQVHWLAIMGNNPSHFKSQEVCEDNHLQTITGIELCPHHPVENVSWESGLEFANRQSILAGLPACYDLSKMSCKGDAEEGSLHCGRSNPVITSGSGRPQDCVGYRFPTEAEWEFAARGETQTAYSFVSDAEKYVWFFLNSDDQTHAVARKRANPYGLHDVHGNVSEMVHDWLNWYPSDAVTDPTGPSSGHYRVVRGGGWANGPDYLCSGRRMTTLPGEQDDDTGFRLVRTLH